MTESEFDTKFNQVFKLRDCGALEDAYNLLLELDKEKSNYAPVLLILGHICWMLERVEEASQFFKRVTILSPKAKKASLGLFHTLFELGDTDGAFEEMKRFVVVGYSEEYERLLEDLRNSRTE